MSQNSKSEPNPLEDVVKNPAARGCLDKLYRNALLILIIIVVGVVTFSLARSAIYKIRPYERGLHLRGGRFIGIDQPGWHIRIPFVDTTIGVEIVERPGTINSLSAMTADDVTMDVSLLYTYRILDPVRYALEVIRPEEIVAGFVQGTLRDVVNTRKMDEVMHSRSEINQQVFDTLQEKEDQYGVEFVLVQIQSASPPVEVVDAIKERMVAEQNQQKSTSEATQARTLADSEFYTAQKKADGEAYQITTLAEADATRINLTSEAQKDALRAVLQELEGKGTLAEKYIQVLLAQELRENSKWIITSGGTLPVIDLGANLPETQPAAAP